VCQGLKTYRMIVSRAHNSSMLTRRERTDLGFEEACIGYSLMLWSRPAGSISDDLIICKRNVSASERPVPFQAEANPLDEVRD
jgi:hypothetical protein